MKLSRRRFVQLIAGTVTSINIPLPSVATILPRLVGDGIHNDAPAINALLDGLPIEVGSLIDTTGAGWAGNVFTLPRGHFLLDAPIIIRGVDGFRLNGNGSTLRLGKADCCIHAINCNAIEFLNIKTGGK